MSVPDAVTKLFESNVRTFIILVILHLLAQLIKNVQYRQLRRIDINQLQPHHHTSAPHGKRHHRAIREMGGQGIGSGLGRT